VEMLSGLWSWVLGAHGTDSAGLWASAEGWDWGAAWLASRCLKPLGWLVAVEMLLICPAPSCHSLDGCTKANRWFLLLFVCLFVFPTWQV
jgi:hypothetical protein